MESGLICEVPTAFIVFLEARTAEVLLFDAEHSFGMASLCPTAGSYFHTGRPRPLSKGLSRVTFSQIWMAENSKATKQNSPNLFSATGASSPLWNADGSGFYYISDHGERACSLWSSIETEKKELLKQKILLCLTVSRDGSTIAYRSGFEFFRLSPNRRAKCEASKISLFPSGDFVRTQSSDAP